MGVRARRVGVRAIAILAGALLLSGCNAPTEPPAEAPDPGAGIHRTSAVPLVPPSSGAVSLGRTGAAGRPVGPPDIVMGTGQFINADAGGYAASGGAIAAGPNVTLDFTGVDVRDVLKSVLGDLLRLNYAVDPAVQGNVTLQTGTPIPRSSLLNVLTDALQLNGTALVLRNGVYLAVPIANAARQAPVGGSAGFVTRIVTPQYVSAAELERALEPTLPAGSTIRVDPARNLLMVSGQATDVSRVLQNVASFDADFMRGMSFALLPLRYGRPRDVAQDVSNMLASSGRTMTDLVKVLPIERMNAVLVTSIQPAYIARVRSWVERFDRGDGRNDPRLYVYRVQNGRAIDLARVLRRALGLDPGPAGAGGNVANEPQGPTAGVPVAGAIDTVGNRMPAGGTTGAAANGIPPELQARSSTDPLAGVNTLASAGGVAGFNAGAPGNQAAPPIMPEVRITADPTNNALIVAASPQDYAVIEAALHKLDIPPLQVLIEATIAEVTLTKQLDLGLQYYFKTGNFTSIFAPNVGKALQATGQATLDSTFPGFGFLAGANVLYSSGDTSLLLQALSKLTTVRVLSSPNLMVLNNGVARLQVGDQVPIATQSATSTLTSTAQTVNAIDYRDTGIILNVVPRVNASGLVLLDISEEVSDASNTGTSKIDSPTISQRRVTSSVAISDGQTIALAGLIRDRTDKSNSGIPWLKDLPVLGPLFGYRSDASVRTELIVLITPHVIRSRDEGDAVTRELREKLRLTIPIVARRR